MKTVYLLILEDDTETLCKLLECVNSLEKELKIDISTTVMGTYLEVEEFLNKNNKIEYQVVLLDRDDKLGGSFHALDFNKYPVEKIIGISSTPPYNEQLKEKGVKRIVHKDYQNLDKFIEEVKGNIIELIDV